MVDIFSYNYWGRLRGMYYGGFFSGCIISKPIRFTKKCIRLENKVVIGRHCRLEGIKAYLGEKFTPQIILGNNVSIQQNLHLTCANHIYIGDNTAIAANVTITDIHHPYDDINTPIELQKIEVKNVHIGVDCKIYNNVVILPGVTIGKHVTIGANSVVNKNIPDYSVAVGIPIRIVKRYCMGAGRWRKTDNNGDFIDK